MAHLRPSTALPIKFGMLQAKRQLDRIEQDCSILKVRGADRDKELAAFVRLSKKAHAYVHDHAKKLVAPMEKEMEEISSRQQKLFTELEERHTTNAAEKMDLLAKIAALEELVQQWEVRTVEKSKTVGMVKASTSRSKVLKTKRQPVRRSPRFLK